MHLAEPWRTAALVAWLVVFLLTLGIFFLVGLPASYDVILAEVQQYGAAVQSLGLTSEFYAGFVVGLDVLRAVIFAAVALLIVWRKPDRLGLFVGLMLVTFGMAFTSTAFHLVPASQPLLHGLAGLISGLGNGLLVVFLYVFPDGRFVPRWTRLLAVIWMIIAMVQVFLPGQMEDSPAAFLFVLAWYLSGVYAQTVRQRSPHTSPTHDQQTKWVVGGLSFALIGYIGYFVPQSLFPGLQDPTTGGLIYRLFAQVVFMTLAQAAIPITIGLSIMHYRLWEVDILLNRTVVYGVLTAVLAGAFLADMVIFQRVMMAVTGGDQIPIVFAASALAAGLTFQPARRRLQRVVDRFLVRHNMLPEAPNTPEAATDPRLGAALTGMQIGPYEVREPLGRGGMAEVYKGRHTALDRPVAIKVLAADRAAETDFRQRFEREAQTVATLKHPNIVEVFDFGTLEGIYYMVMEYVDGQDLSQYLRETGPLSLASARPIAAGIASALDYAHRQGIVHRDVKPSNVMLQAAANPAGPELRPVLTDFGIAKIRSRQTGLTKTGTIGTLDYMAPEQIVSSREVDGRADVYSLGVMLYQMLTGTLPFAGDNPGAVILGHLQQTPPDPRTLVPDLPEIAARTILRCLEKDPGARFQTTGAVADALDRAQANSLGGSRRTGADH